MADIATTAASVINISGGTVNTSYRGSALIVPGQTVYLNASQQWALATAAGTALQSGSTTTWGIAINQCLAAGQPLAVFVAQAGQTSQINIGQTAVTAGTPTVNPTGGGASGGNLAAGTYYAKYTDVYASGETPASTETAQFTVASGNIPQITMAAIPAGATRNIYLTLANGASGSEVRYATGVSTTTYSMSAANTGTISPPSALVAGNVLMISNTAGNIAPYADIVTNGTSGWFYTFLGTVIKSGSNFYLDMATGQATGQTHA